MAALAKEAAALPLEERCLMVYLVFFEIQREIWGIKARGAGVGLEQGRWLWGKGGGGVWGGGGVTREGAAVAGCVVLWACCPFFLYECFCFRVCRVCCIFLWYGSSSVHSDGCCVCRRSLCFSVLWRARLLCTHIARNGLSPSKINCVARAPPPRASCALKLITSCLPVFGVFLASFYAVRIPISSFGDYTDNLVTGNLQFDADRSLENAPHTPTFLPIRTESGGGGSGFCGGSEGGRQAGCHRAGGHPQDPSRDASTGWSLLWLWFWLW